MNKNSFLLIFIVLLISSFSSVYGQKKKIRSKNKPAVDTIHVIGHAHMDMNWLWTYFTNASDT